MIYLASFFYLVSFVFQALSSWFALISFRPAGKYRYGWLFLSLALLLMLGRRISPIFSMWQDLHFDIVDAALSVPISLLLMLGVLSLRKALRELDEKTQQLLASQKLDFLTSAFTRAELFIAGEREVGRSLRTGHPFALLMLDLDHFKEINDQYGHQCGDDVLKSLACICQNSLRRIDVFARYGGEEFVVILPETAIENAKVAAERLRKNVGDHLGFASGLQDKKITISVGISTFESKGNPEENPASLFKILLEQADTAMYQAKNLGRNQVSVFECSNCI